MKVCMIKASAKSAFKTYKKSRGGLPQNIFALAAATPPGIDIEMIDETVNGRVNYRSDCDLVVLMFSTPDALRGYEHARNFKKRGKTVIFGGLHPSFMPDEALEYGDSVIIGEAEPVWETVLDDFRHGQLKPTYRAQKAVDLATVNPYPTDLITVDKYDWIWTVSVSRGCPFSCEFCTVNKFFHGIRYRPIENIVAEIENSPTEYIELKADNLTVNRKYCLELFEALKPLNIKWSVEADIRLTRDEELLAAAAESGLHYVLVGIETPSSSALKAAGKNFVKPEQLKQDVAKLHEYGIIVDASALFGFDSHDDKIFEETLAFFDEIEVDVCDSVITVPYPGTALYNRLGSEGRILTRDWSKYDGAHAVFKPAKMSPYELEEGAYWFHRQWNSLMRRYRRKKRQVKQLGRENAEWIARTF